MHQEECLEQSPLTKCDVLYCASPGWALKLHQQAAHMFSVVSDYPPTTNQHLYKSFGTGDSIKWTRAFSPGGSVYQFRPG